MTPPQGIPTAEYQQQYPTNGSGVWRAIAMLVSGSLLGMIAAWFTALQSKGITSKDLEDYVANHSPYMVDKGVIAEHQAEQDRHIGELSGRQERVLDRLSRLESDDENCKSDRQDLRKNIDLITNWMNAEKSLKR